MKIKIAGKPQKAELDKTRLLVVEDERTIRELFIQILASQLSSARIDAVVNGAEAVQAFRDIHYGVILMDIYMPVMDGIKAYDEIVSICKKEGMEIPAFVFCTGYEPPRGIIERIGGDMKHCILNKPVRNNDLVNALVSRLELPAREQEK